ncbi:pre-mRNA-splicing factor CWC22 [Cocos nucifera]|uniref:Pre-mRNA-splicing factor CWC22 n=1 Tax=Cocos nucifera TaxID=13894 RepID=A0A8K0NFB1_COCNU|nr:pre-mRNA-splicing factor CWC22 [Cocos nucifera]
MVKEEPSQALTEDERRALRGSKFAPLPAPAPGRTQPRVAHPGGPVTTNKAAALARFLERKLQQPDGLKSMDPNLLELAVKDAKATVHASNEGSSASGRMIRHVSSFGDSSENSGEDQDKEERTKQKKRKKKKLDSSEDSGEDLAREVKPKQKKRKKRKKKVVQSPKSHKAVKQRKIKS